MPDPFDPHQHRFRILHVFRAPVGGLFRHVMDLAEEQIRQGHAVGLVVDSQTGGTTAERVLAAIAPRLELGLTRLPMRRDPHPADVSALMRVARVIATAEADVVHGHGSKGALYARLAGLPWQKTRPIRVYTPHGGSLHFDPRSVKGRLVLGTEQLLRSRSDLILFESGYAAERFQAVVGETAKLTRIVHNGLAPAEFVPVVERTDAADFLYVGELRLLKGVDVFLKALAGLQSGATRPRALIVGAGPDQSLFESLTRDLGLDGQVRFAGVLPAREAFALGRTLVVPSRAESLPYIVLEAAAAQRPLLATRVGGIPEIVGPHADRLVAPDDVAALGAAMADALARSRRQRENDAAALATHVQSRFSLRTMVDGVLAGYRESATRLAAGSDRKSRPSLLPHRSRILGRLIP